MKLVIVFLFLVVSFSAFSQPIILEDYNWPITDITFRGHKKEDLFRSMNREEVRLKDSICSNRAHVWAYDFHRKQDLDTAKIFFFFTKENGRQGWKTWWYHVAPVINERHQLWVMDAGFPEMIKGPMLTQDWLKNFSDGGKCKEIRMGDNELIEKIYTARVFPEKTSYGKYDCYYSIAPAGYWTPKHLAMNLLGQDEAGNPVNFSREAIHENEVYEACLETSTSKLGWILGEGHKKCRRYLRNELL